MTASARSGDQTAYLLHDANFHRTLLAASANPLLIGLAGMVSEAIVRPAPRRLNTLCTPSGMIPLHGNVVSATESGAFVTAKCAARAILTGDPPLPDSGHPLPESARPALLVTA